MIWFTSDQHWCHANIIQYCQRPFANVSLMNDTMIDRWNDAVKPDDVVFHLGDFGFFRGKSEVAQDIIMRLNGHIHFVPGSHDKDLVKWLAKGTFAPKMVLEPPLLTIEPLLPNGKTQPIVLCHYAMRHWERSFHMSWQLHGHTHGRLRAIGLQLDVGADCWAFRPVSLERVAEQMAKVPVVKNDSLV